MPRTPKQMETPMKYRKTMKWLLALALAGSVTGTLAVTKFEPAQTVADTPLVLNGAGTRFRTIFAVYDLGLYLKSRARTPEAVLEQPGPKKLSFVALRELSGTDLGVAFMKGLDANSPKNQVTRHTAATTRLIEIFSGKARLMPGETFSMDYTPGKGTVFFINGKAQGTPVGDAEFFTMVLRIWLGPAPADWKLKDALLGAEN